VFICSAVLIRYGSPAVPLPPPYAAQPVEADSSRIDTIRNAPLNPPFRLQLTPELLFFESVLGQLITILLKQRPFFGSCRGNNILSFLRKQESSFEAVDPCFRRGDMTRAALCNNDFLPFFMPSRVITDYEAGVGHTPIPKTFTLARLLKKKPDLSSGIVKDDRTSRWSGARLRLCRLCPEMTNNVTFFFKKIALFEKYSKKT
jgi:hypothetical protein